MVAPESSAFFTAFVVHPQGHPVCVCPSPAEGTFAAVEDDLWTTYFASRRR
jgi:hypothetical protein